MYLCKFGQGIYERQLSRRHFLKLGILTAAGTMSASSSLAAVRNLLPQEKALSLYNIHTGERFNTIYWSQGEYIAESLYDINYIMRDFRKNKIKQIDFRLLDLLYDMRCELNTKEVFHIVSGFRSPETNNMLRKYSNGVAKNSLHMYGKAVDIRVPSRKLSEVRRAAVNQRGGGVGYYPRSNFLHVDVGRRRFW